MKVNESISPSAFKNVILVLGLFMVFLLWQFGSKKVADFRYQYVFGEQISSAVSGSAISLDALPIVLAQSEHKGVDVEDLNDLAIEAAFKVPEFVDDEVKAPTVTTAERFYMSYRPKVAGVSKNGAIINGVFWRTGEALNTMPLANDAGESLIPMLVSVASDRVVITIGGDKVTLPFEMF